MNKQKVASHVLKAEPLCKKGLAQESGFAISAEQNSYCRANEKGTFKYLTGQLTSYVHSRYAGLVNIVKDEEDRGVFVNM